MCTLYADIAAKENVVLVITYREYQRKYNRPDFTHVMLGGRIVEAGGPELASYADVQTRPFARNTSGGL